MATTEKKRKHSHKQCAVHLCFLNENEECEICLDEMHQNEQAYLDMAYDDLTEDGEDFDY